jgi:hypothetical protein
MIRSVFRDDNKRILDELEVDKLPYTFDCDDLLIIMGCTTSVRTKLTMVTTLAPRLTNPKSKMDIIVNSFRFAEEKETAQEALRSRIQVLNGTLFKKKLLNQARGGRGNGQLGNAGRGASNRQMISADSRVKDSDDEEDEEDEDEFVPDPTVDVHQIYGGAKKEDPNIPQLDEEEETFEGDSDDEDIPPTSEPAISESITSSVFKAFNYFGGGTK